MPDRVYFKDEQGNEIDTPHNGKVYTGCGSWVKDDYGHYMKDTRVHVSVAKGRDDYINLTIDDFPGHERVFVKVWNPEDGQEFFSPLLGFKTRVEKAEDFYLC